MDFASKIINAVTPNPTSEMGSQDSIRAEDNSHVQQPEDNMPGAFPDTDNAQGRTNLNERNEIPSGQQQRDSGIDIDHASAKNQQQDINKHNSNARATTGSPGASSSHTNPIRSTSNSGGDMAFQAAPEQASETRDYGKVDSQGTGRDNTPHLSDEPTRMTSGDHTSDPVGAEELHDNDKATGRGWTTTAVKPQHLGNEGKEPRSRGSTFGEPLSESIPSNQDVDPISHDSRDEREGGAPTGPASWPSTQEVGTQHLGNEGKILGSGFAPPPGTQIPSSSGGENKSAGLERQEENLGQYSGPGSSGADNSNMAAAHQHAQNNNMQPIDNTQDDIPGAESDPTLRVAHHQARGTHMTSEIPVKPASNHSGMETEDPSVAAPRRQMQDNANATRAELKTEPSGGIHNGVHGTGSDDPKGLSGESPHKRMSDSRKGEVRNTISGVSQSGLGQGGVHNGIVGHGSKDDTEESSRHSSGARGTQETSME